MLCDAHETTMQVEGEDEVRCPVLDDPAVEQVKQMTLAIELQKIEVVNCPGAMREALQRQKDLARATAELSTARFGGFNHGCMSSAVGGPMSLCKKGAGPNADWRPQDAFPGADCS